MGDAPQQMLQQMLPGLESGRATIVSPSSLDRYRRCPRQYRFLYVDGLWQRARTGPAQSFGTSIHAALREFFRQPLARRTLDRLLALFRRSWVPEGYTTGDDEARERARGERALRAWYDRTDTTVVPHATEVGLSASFGDIVLKGRLDRVDHAPGGALTVVDYKTGIRPASQAAADANEALTIYAALAERRLGRPVDALVLDYVVAGAHVATTRPPEVLRERLARVLDAAAVLRDDQVFPPRPGSWCASCDFLGLCPEGRAATAERGGRLD